MGRSKVKPAAPSGPVLDACPLGERGLFLWAIVSPAERRPSLPGRALRTLLRDSLSGLPVEAALLLLTPEEGDSRSFGPEAEGTQGLRLGLDAAASWLARLAKKPGSAPRGDGLALIETIFPRVLAAVGRGLIEPAPRYSGRAAGWSLPHGPRAALQDAFAPAVPAAWRRQACSRPGDPGAPGGGTPQSARNALGGLLDGLADALVRAAARPGGEPGDAAWLRDLTGSQGPRPSRADELRTRAGLEARRAVFPPDPPVRSLLRLCEPAASAPDTWTLELVPAVLPDRRARELARLAALGELVRVYPRLERLLADPARDRLELTASQAQFFVGEVRPLLGKSGVEVAVPGWWTEASRGLEVSVRLAPASGGVGAEALLDFDVRLALGEAEISAAELAELAAEKRWLVQRGGRWAVLDPERVHLVLAAVAEGKTGGSRLGLVAALTRLAGLDERLAADDARRGRAPRAAAIASDGWVRDLLSGAGGQTLVPVPVPTSFTGSLRPYQERGLSWLAFLDRLGLGACLADDMGLGKTVQFLALMAHERGGGRPGPTLLVAPMSVLGNWEREARRFVPELVVHVHHGFGRRQAEGFAAVAAESDLVVTSYSLLHRDQKTLGGIHWHRVVLDEAQNIKNAGAYQTRAAKALPCSRRLALTGTPLENRLAELWSIFDFLVPGLLGSATRFDERYARPIEKDRSEARAEGLRRLVRPFLLRRLKSDPAIAPDLPEKEEIRCLVNLTREQAGLYQAVVDELAGILDSVDGIRRRGVILAALTRLKQICNHPVQVLRDGSDLAGRSGKLALLEEVLDEILGAGEKVLCFTQYAELGDLLAPYLEGRLGVPVLWLHGGTRREAREEMLVRFAAPDGPAIFLLSLKAGGTGLNLTAATQVVHFDRWWNPAVEDQATDRAHRIGQTKKVQVRKLVCLGTLEEKIDAMLAEKRDLAARVVGAGEEWLTELSTESLLDLVSLSADAVGEA